MSEKKKDFFQLAIPLLLNHILEVQAKKQVKKKSKIKHVDDVIVYQINVKKIRKKNH